MDVIISASDEIKEVIMKVPLGEDNKINPDLFRELVLRIAQGKEEDEV